MSNGYHHLTETFGTFGGWRGQGGAVPVAFCKGLARKWLGCRVCDPLPWICVRGFNRARRQVPTAMCSGDLWNGQYGVAAESTNSRHAERLVPAFKAATNRVWQRLLRPPIGVACSTPFPADLQGRHFRKDGGGQGAASIDRPRNPRGGSRLTVHRRKCGLQKCWL